MVGQDQALPDVRVLQHHLQAAQPGAQRRPHHRADIGPDLAAGKEHRDVDHALFSSLRFQDGGFRRKFMPFSSAFASDQP
jgi:hypothetical protein